jgi:glycosyltransferase involved in cell wall biosynthesis
MPTRRVLMTADTMGGVWTYALELARALGAAGVSVDLATMGAPLGACQWGEAGQIPSLRVFESTFRLEWMEEPWDDLARAGDWLLGLERAARPDVVHLNGYAHGALPWRAPTLMVGHSCVLSWWEAVRGGRPPRAWDRYAREVRRGLAAAGTVVAPTRAMLDGLARHYGLRGGGRVIANGRSAAALAPARKRPFVLSAGRVWDEAKNLAALDRAADGLPWPVYVAGDDTHPQGGRITLRHVCSLGRLPAPSLAAWLARAAIYALPARYEPFGLSILEAGLAGCALVLGDVPSLREVWGEAATWVPPDHPAALRAALCALMDDDRRRGEMARRARERALGFTPERMASAYLEAYGALPTGGRKLEAVACAS